MRYQHRFTVQAAIEGVVAFHHNNDNLKLLTPRPIEVRIRRAPHQLHEGAVIDFELDLGLVAVRWQARFENLSAHAFPDRRIVGPFASWSHRHVFHRIGEQQTEIEDHIEAT